MKTFAFTCAPHHHHSRHYSHRRRHAWLPGWLLRIVGISLILSALFLLRACALENQRILRDVSTSGGVQSWTRSTGRGDVLFGSLNIHATSGGNSIVEGLVSSTPAIEAKEAKAFRWLCDSEGRVLHTLSAASSPQDTSRP